MNKPIVQNMCESIRKENNDLLLERCVMIMKLNSSSIPQGSRKYRKIANEFGRVETVFLDDCSRSVYKYRLLRDPGVDWEYLSPGGEGYDQPYIFYFFINAVQLMKTFNFFL